MYGGSAPALQPFAYGTKPQEIQLYSQVYSPGQQLQWLLPKSGYIAEYSLLMKGSVTVSGAGTAGTPKLWNLINRLTLNVSFGYNYRNIDGDSLYFGNQVREPGIDRVLGSPLYETYDPTSVSTQSVSLYMKDEIYMDEGIDFDMFLIPYQSLAKQLYLTIQCGQLGDIAANTETISAAVINIQPTIKFFTQPDTTKFMVPDTSMSQQILDEYDNQGQLLPGVQLVHLTPINGPEFLGLGFKIFLNGVPDSVDFNTNLVQIRILANSTVPVIVLTAESIIQFMYEHFQRRLPPGWFYLPWSDDISLVNAMGPAQRNVFDTKEYTQLDLEITLKTNAVVGTNNYVKLWKRLQSQAVIS